MNNIASCFHAKSLKSDAYVTLTAHAVGWMFVSSPNSHTEILIPTVNVLGGGALGRLGHEGGALRDGISVLIKRTPRSSLALCEDTMRKGLSGEPDMLAPQSQTSQSPELGEINFHCLWANQSVVLCYRSPNGGGQHISTQTRHISGL